MASSSAKRYAIVGICVLSLNIPLLWAQTTSDSANDSQWIADAIGCKVWNPNPRPNETITWSGTCQSGLANGDGTLEWFIDGKPNGVNSGTFQDGKQTGHGLAISPNGNRYEGSFVNGRLSGVGSLTFRSGNRYEGAFVDGQRTGQGTYSWTNGDSYQGEFLNGRFHGKGSLVKINGERLDGNFVGGKAHGPSTITRSDGTRISGIMTNGKFTPETTPSNSLFNDSHSIESIRSALKSPIPDGISQRARQFDDQVLRSGKIGEHPVSIVTDQRLSRVTQIANRLLNAIKADPSKWTIRVLETNPPQENAFVVGGHYIYVYTGLLNNAQSDDELGFILGHEISHSLLKHNLRRSEDFTHLLGSIIELSGAFTRNQNRKEQRALVGGAIKSAYSREDEQEADALGAYIAKVASYDPLHGVAFFNRAAKREAEIKFKSKEALATSKRTIDQQIANCRNLRAQWNSSPQLRTNQNAQIVNSACKTAQENLQKYNTYTVEQSSHESKSALLRTHPADQDRIATLAAIVDFLFDKRPLSSLQNMGQGYKVFVAMDLK